MDRRTTEFILRGLQKLYDREGVDVIRGLAAADKDSLVQATNEALVGLLEVQAAQQSGLRWVSAPRSVPETRTLALGIVREMVTNGGITFMGRKMVSLTT
ncbi:MAG: hypothetical protein AB1798_11750 [Spirochaetota bacterium]